MTPDKPLVASDLLEIMQCPACSGSLAERREPPSLVCGDCTRAYPVRDGIPIMLVEEAEET